MERIKTLIIKVPGGRRVGGSVMMVFRRWQARRKAEPNQSVQKPSSKLGVVGTNRSVNKPSAKRTIIDAGRSLNSSPAEPSSAEASQFLQSSSTKPRVLVTGSCGTLGSRLVEFLGKEGYDVIGYDIKVDPSEDLSNYELLKDRMAGCQFVVHTAAIPHPRLGSIKDYFEMNVVGSFNVMRAAAAKKVKRFIYFSSGAYYGWDIKGKLWPAYFPIDEAHPIASMPGRAEGLLSAYDQSKVMAEQLLAWYGTNKVFEAISLRIAPANKKADQYPADGSWLSDPGFRRRGLWTNFNPDMIGEVVKCALEASGEFWYEPFNICDKYAHERTNVKAFLTYEYPDVPVKCDLSDNSSLLTPAKAERMLGFKPCEDVK